MQCFFVIRSPSLPRTMAHNLVEYLIFGLYVKCVAAIPVTDVASNIRATVGFPTAAPTKTPNTLSTGLYSNTTTSQFTPWTNCTTEGIYQCLGSNIFQQCRYGRWSVAGSVTVEEECNFHGEIEDMFPTPPGLLIEIVRSHLLVIIFHFLLGTQHFFR